MPVVPSSYSPRFHLNDSPKDLLDSSVGEALVVLEMIHMKVAYPFRLFLPIPLR